MTDKNNETETETAEERELLLKAGERRKRAMQDSDATSYRSLRVELNDGRDLVELR
jgi:hypothetical protein